LRPSTPALGKAQFKVQWNTSDFRQWDTTATEEIRERNQNTPFYRMALHYQMEKTGPCCR